MRRDYRLYELNDEEFEQLIVRICVRWLGNGVTPFAPGRDGGRDGKFDGKANSFPSAAAPLNGRCVLQAKHVSAPDRSCSDAEFKRLLKNEYAKIKRLIKDGICDHYILFTNRKLTGETEKNLIKELEALGLQTAHIVGAERLSLALDDIPEIRDTLPNRNDPIPFRFDPDDLVEVISALQAYTTDSESQTAAFNSAQDFHAISIRSEKNKINGLTSEYYQEILVARSMQYFPRIEEFLKNPRNGKFADLYHDAADELKEKILRNRTRFDTFDDVFAFLYEGIQSRRTALKGKRRLISVLLHYMYFNCDIGSKTTPPVDEAECIDADA